MRVESCPRSKRLWPESLHPGLSEQHDRCESVTARRVQIPCPEAAKWFHAPRSRSPGGTGRGSASATSDAQRLGTGPAVTVLGRGPFS